jgi:hypothetical protein
VPISIYPIFPGFFGALFDSRKGIYSEKRYLRAQTPESRRLWHRDYSNHRQAKVVCERALGAGSSAADVPQFTHQSFRSYARPMLMECRFIIQSQCLSQLLPISKVSAPPVIEYFSPTCMHVEALAAKERSFHAVQLVSLISNWNRL